MEIDRWRKVIRGKITTDFAEDQDTFYYEDQEWNLTLGWEGSEIDGKHIVLINEERSDEMPRFHMKEPTHAMMRSKVDPDMDGSKMKQTIFSLLITKIPVSLIVFHNYVTRFTRISIGKYCIVVRNRKLKSKKLWPQKRV